MSNSHKIGICGATKSSFLTIILLAFICTVAAGDDANQLDFSTKECVLTEPVYGYKFDFNGLRSDLAHVVQGENNEVFEFNVCSNLTHTCNNESNVAACLKKQGKEYVLGRQQELYYHNGKMHLNYSSGAKCENGTDDNATYQFFIKLKCDYTLDANPIHITSYADNACSFYIDFETPLACLPIPDAQQSSSCSVPYSKTGDSFDLLPLSEYNYRTTNRQGGVFIINICKPVLYGENATCPAGSSICLYEPKATELKKRFINIGNVQSQPIILDNKLLLRHESSTPCAGNSSVNYRSVVNFYCDRRVMNPHPEFLGEDGCTYHFSFYTPLACKVEKPCLAVSSTNELLDLSPLIAHSPHKLTKDGKTYTISVCASAGTSSLSDSGASYEEKGQTYSLGHFNSHLRFNQSDSPYLLYEEGVICDAKGRRWSTKIEFVCANNVTKNNGVGGGANTSSSTDAVQIIEDANCQLLIQYQTPYACLEQIPCKGKTYVQHNLDSAIEEYVDLTPLINVNENYEARVALTSKSDQQQLPKNTKFFLNVCRPLVPKYQLGCAGGSGACMAKISTAGAPEEEHSLGFPSIQMSVINRTNAILLYPNGDPCPTDKSLKLSTRIHFSCNMRAGRGQPVLSSIDDCCYDFDWETSAICPPHECNFRADTCEIAQDEAGMRFNFKNASFTHDGQIEFEYKTHKSVLNVCGLDRKAITDYSQDLVNLYFTHDLPGCGNEGKMSVQMRFICSNINNSSYIITEDPQCLLLYTQRTPSICQFLGLSVPHEEESSTTSTTTTTTSSTITTTTTTTSISPTGKPTEAGTTAASLPASIPAAVPSPTASVGTIMGLILSVTFFVACLGMFAFSPARRQRVRRLFRRSSSAVRYSRVQSNEEANLLLEPNGEFTESDDDMLL